MSEEINSVKPDTYGRMLYGFVRRLIMLNVVVCATIPSLILYICGQYTMMDFNGMRIFRPITLLLLLFTTGVTEAQHPTNKTESQLKRFYIAYMTALDEMDRAGIETLLQDHLTPEMQEKRARLICTTNSDPLIRAQDVSEEGIHSVRCRPLSGNWFEVSYILSSQDTVRIPVRVASCSSDTVRISYVTPYWGGNDYGDSLFDIPKQEVVNDRSGLLFVETFFRSYAYPYVTMSLSIYDELEQIRRSHCTSSMLRKYAETKEEVKWEEPCFDPIIGDSDFDAFWYNTLRIDTMSENTFKVSFAKNKLRVEITNDAGMYRIADVKVLP